MGFWATTLAMTMGASLGPLLHKIILLAWSNTPQMRHWKNRGYGTTYWMVFAPKWLKRITKKGK